MPKAKIESEKLTTPKSRITDAERFDMGDESVLRGTPERKREEIKKIKSVFLDQLHQLCDHRANPHLNLRENSEQNQK